MIDFVREITCDEYQELHHEGLLESCDIRNVEECDFWGRTYEMSTGGLLLRQTCDPVKRIRDDLAMRQAPRTAIDLFAGAGGMSVGLEAAGFDVIGAAEWDPIAVISYLSNLGHPDCRLLFDGVKSEQKFNAAVQRLISKKRIPEKWIAQARLENGGSMTRGCRVMYSGDIARLSGKAMLEALGVDAVDVVVGGPPCQGISISNNKRRLGDPRNALLGEFMRFVDEVRPVAFVMENVPQLLTMGDGILIKQIAEAGNQSGYNVVAQLLDACGYGVAQHRRRALIVGTQTGCRYTYPMPSHWAMGFPIDGESWRPCSENGGDSRESEESEAGLLFA